MNSEYKRNNTWFPRQRVFTRKLEEQKIKIDSQTRHFFVVQPESYAAGNPVVLLLHGGTQSMRKVLGRNTTTQRWLTLAEREGFLLVVPNGINVRKNDAYGDFQTWNDLRPGTDGRRSRADDVAFLVTLVKLVTQKYDSDRNRVFVTGVSNGGMMAMRLLVEEPHYFSGAAVFSASLPLEEIPDAPASTPIMMMNGTDDPLVPWEGGIVSSGADPVRSINATVAYWARINRAKEELTKSKIIPNHDPTDPCQIIETSYYMSADQPPVILFYRVQGGGHSVPAMRPPQYPPAIQKRLGYQCQALNGIDLAWGFMQKFAEARSR